MDQGSCNFFLNPSLSRLAFMPTILLSSSVVELSAVNRLVVGSNPTSGAIFQWYILHFCGQDLIAGKG